MNRWHLLKDRLDTRPLHNLLLRSCNILVRYGVTQQRFGRALDNFLRLLDEYGITPTIPVTASVLNRHPVLFKKIQECGVELAIHGYRHVDYTQVSIEDVSRELELASEIFDKQGIKYSGHRFPYLRQDSERIELLEQAGFQWDSSEVLSWNSLDQRTFSKRRWTTYQKILKTYKVINADVTFALPSIRKGLVEIPVSMPDDDILIERLGLKDDEMMKMTWESMARRVRERGELLVLDVHPERFKWYRNSLEKTLQLVKVWGDVWTASLAEIARWWREREKFHFQVDEISKNRYRITAICTERGTVLQKNGLPRRDEKKFLNATVVDARRWEIESPTKPVIGIEPETPSEVIHFLKMEGFAYELTEKLEDCSFVLKHRGNFDENKKRQILGLIDRSRLPIIRFWRWPEQARYCLAVTGDVDCVDLWDFGERFYGK